MKSRIRTLLVGAAVGLALVACGGGDDDNGNGNTGPAPAVTDAVPTSASQTVVGFIGYLKALVVASADLLDPVDVSSVTPPVAETSEPDPSI